MGKKTLILGGLGAGVAVLAVFVVGGLTRAGSDPASRVPTYEVKRSDLTISVTEGGTIKSLDQRTVKSEVEGQTTIIWLVEEGKRVEQGELLIELDASALVDRRVDQQINVQNAEASFIRAREQLEVVRSQNRSDVLAAELDERFAREDLIKYLEGEYPSQLMEAQAAVTLAEEELRRAADKFEWSTRLFEEKYVSETEFRADELAHKRAELEVTLAKEALKLLEEYTHTRRVTELDAAIEQTKMALDRVQRKAASDLVQADADLKAKEAEYGQQRDKLAKIDDQISKTKIKAPVAGMVVYATSAEMRWRGDSQPLQEGTQVREREDLIFLPTADSMMVEMKVHESSLGKIVPGQRAEVRVDAVPDRVYQGRVARIAPLPDATSVWLNPDLKVFSTQIVIDGSHPELRTGMSCKAEVFVDHYDDALAVPMQCVVREGGVPKVYVIEGGQSVVRTVEIGLDNNSLVHVLAGLEPGERVSMVPPLSAEPRRRPGRPADEPALAGAGGSGETAAVESVAAPAASAPAEPGAGRPSGAPGGGSRPVRPAGGAAMPPRSGG